MSGGNRGFAVRNAGIAVVIVALAAVAGWFWWQGRTGAPADGGGSPPAIDSAGGTGVTTDPSTDAPPPSPFDEPDTDDPPSPAVADTWAARLGELPSFPDPLHGAASCEEVDAALERVCRAIDAGVALDGAASCAFLEDAATRLAGRAPALPEARDPDSWLSNAFHLFRVLRGERIGTARRLVEGEPELIEPLALAAYRWAITRESCREDGAPVAGLTPARLYDYGTFAFTSFGGQAYLRRRAPRLEALGCFYALSALDLSIEQGHNPHGVDPRREIERCRELVGAQPFVWGDAYDRELGRMDAAWRRRAGSG